MSLGSQQQSAGSGTESSHLASTAQEQARTLDAVTTPKTSSRKAFLGTEMYSSQDKAPETTV